MISATLDGYYRDAEKTAIRSCLENYIPFKSLPSALQTELVILLERGCNNETFDKALQRNIPKIWDEPRYVEQYSNIGYHLKVNLDPESDVNANKSEEAKTYVASMVVNYMIRKMLINQHEVLWKLIFEYIPYFDPKEVASMSGREINPHLSQANWLKIKEREKQSINTKFTKMYPCSQCGTRRATFKKIQSRALDEDNTLFIECDECGHNWRIY